MRLLGVPVLDGTVQANPDALFGSPEVIEVLLDDVLVPLGSEEGGRHGAEDGVWASGDVHPRNGTKKEGEQCMWFGWMAKVL